MFINGINLKLFLFGQSHSRVMGVVITGCSKDLVFNIRDLQNLILRRKGPDQFSTPRKEPDIPVIAGGLKKMADQYVSTGAPITIIFENSSCKSEDYAKFSEHPRPGHADIYSMIKYNQCKSPAGGGFFSGRMTLLICAAAWIAKEIVKSFMPGFNCRAYFRQIGNLVLQDPSGPVDEAGLLKILQNKEHELTKSLNRVKDQGNTLGGVISCRASKIYPGLGEPWFNSCESMISSLLFSIPGVKALEFGAGFKGAAMTGTEYNDLITDSLGMTESNNSGGIIGGLTTGNTIDFNVLFRPGSSVKTPQQTYNIRAQKTDELVIKGRHDICYALRTPVIVESVLAIVMADLALGQYKRDKNWFYSSPFKPDITCNVSRPDGFGNPQINPAAPDTPEYYNTLLQTYRELIDIKDEQIINLLNERMSICVEAGRIKAKSGKKTADPQRESRILQKLADLTKKDRALISPDFVKKLWKEIFDFSKKIQKKLQNR
jgi:chorismate synthase